MPEDKGTVGGVRAVQPVAGRKTPRATCGVEGWGQGVRILLRVMKMRMEGVVAVQVCCGRVGRLKLESVG